jgi:hypothetical protein
MLQNQNIALGQAGLANVILALSMDAVQNTNSDIRAIAP